MPACSSSHAVPTPWIARQRPRPQASVRLFCFPFAGGGASSYRTWSDELPNDIEVMPIQPPGHEDRYAEVPFRKMEHLVEGLVESLESSLSDLPFAFFGHSLGGVVALEAARYLTRRQAPLPCHVLISGRSAPHLPPRRVPVAQLSREELKSWLRTVGGTSEAVLQSRELMDLVLPVVRADLQIDDTYRSGADPPLSSPLTVLGGLRDEQARPGELQGWSQYTAGAFSLRLIDGDHFFPFNESRPSVLAAVVEALSA